MSDLYEEGNNKNWQGYSVTDSFVYSKLPPKGLRSLFRPLCKSDAGRPQLPIVNSNTKGSSTLYVFVSSDAEPYFTEVSFKSCGTTNMMTIFCLQRAMGITLRSKMSYACLIPPQIIQTWICQRATAIPSLQ